MGPDPDPGGQKHVDPVDPDPDPEHCFKAVSPLYNSVPSANVNITTYYNPMIFLTIFFHSFVTTATASAT